MKKTDTLAEQAYRLVKQAILRGEFPEGTFLSEAELTKRFKIGRTPYREACNRLHNEQLLEVVPRRGYFVPEMSFRAVRDLLETRLIIEGVVAELAAQRAEPEQLVEFEELFRAAVDSARKASSPETFVAANMAFHLHLARMAQNRELEGLLRGVLERSTRMFHLVVKASPAPAREVEALLRPIVEAVKGKDAAAAHQAVIKDITQGQLNVFGRELWEKAR